MNWLERANDPEHYPGSFDQYLGKLIREGYTDEEAIAEAVHPASRELPADQRFWRIRAAAIRRQTGAVPAADPTTEPDRIEDGPIPDRGTDLTRSEILRFRREWQQDGGDSPWKRAGVSEATYIRHRHRHGLVPWPEGYLRRLTP